MTGTTKRQVGGKVKHKHIYKWMDRELWDSIYEKKGQGWAGNPPVIRIAFERRKGDT
jgi:hypothetical protein